MGGSGLRDLGGDVGDHRDGIPRLRDRPTDDEITGSSCDRLRRGHHPFLVGIVPAMWADPWNHARQIGFGSPHRPEFEPAADDARTSGRSRRLGANHYELAGGSGMPSLTAGSFVLTREDRHRENPKLILGFVDACPQMIDPAPRVHGEKPNPQATNAANRAPHCVGDVVQLEVEKDSTLRRLGSYRIDHLRALGHEQLEPDLEQSHLTPQGASPRHRVFGSSDIQGNDDPLTSGVQGIRHGRRAAITHADRFIEARTSRTGGSLRSAISFKNPSVLGIVAGMVSSDVRQRLFDALESGVNEHAFPGCVALVWRDGSILYHEAHGTLATHPLAEPWQQSVVRDTVYDLASLTKVLATTTLVAVSIARGRMALTDPVPRPWVDACPGATLEDLLEHRAGLLAHREYFTDVTPFDARAVLDRVSSTPPAYPLRSRAIYSDLGFIILGAWLERVWARPLLELFDDLVAFPLALRRGTPPSLAFRPIDGKPAPHRTLARIAPTEVYDPALHPLGAPSHVAVRRSAAYAHGEVHDDNAYVMGGVAGHAGLFGTAEGVLEVAIAWLRASVPGMDFALRDRFWTPSDIPGSTRRLGFDGPDPDGHGSTGTALTPTAVGHTGYTGTSVWIDPQLRAIFVLLSNRVHPTRANDAIKAVRQRFHTLAAALVE